MIKLAIIDDHPVARWGLEHLFSDCDDIQIVTCAPSPNQFDGADVVVLDLYLQSDVPSLAEIGSLSATSRVLVMSASGRQADVLAALRAGAVGYLTKDADDTEFVSAVRTVATGGFYLSSSVANLLQDDVDRSTGDHPALSAREEQTLGYIARGYTHAQAARRMNITTATVDSYVERIRRKLNLGNKAELTRKAIELNLVLDTTRIGDRPTPSDIAEVGPDRTEGQ